MKRRVLFALLSAAVLTAVFAFGAMNTADQLFSDAFYQRAGAASEDIVVIGLDQEALDVLGPLPWPRDYMADAIAFLNNAEADARPAVIGVDVLYTGESHTDPEGDRRLAEAAGQYGNVVVPSAAVFGSAFSEEDGRYSVQPRTVVAWENPYEALKEAAGTGHGNAMADTDGILRHALLYVDVPEEGRVDAFARVIYERWCASEGKTPSPPPETSDDGFFYLPYSASGGQYCEGVGFLDLLDGTVDPALFRNKIVLIGPYAPGMQDTHPTSLDRASLMYGIDVHANLIQAFMKGFFPREIRAASQLFLLFLLCAAAAWFFWKTTFKNALIGWVGGCLGWLAICALCYRLGWILHPLWLPTGLTVLMLASVFLSTMRIRDEKRRIASELEIASRIQRDMLPDHFDPFPECRAFELYASTTPAKQVGGDFFDVFPIDEDHLGLAVGDVSGKGIPASLFMTVAMTLIRDHALQEKSPATVLREVNHVLCSRNDESMFVTAWMGIVQLSAGVLTAANAGHEYPILRQERSYELFKDRHGLPLGAMDGSRYREYTIQLTPGTALFLYSDGMAEAINRQQEQFGTDRAIEVLNTSAGGSAEEIVRAVHEAVDRFAGEEPQFDDLTLLSFLWRGSEQGITS